MDASKQPRRRSQAQLWTLLALALIGYEVVLYRYWRQSIPLRPSRVLELDENQVPIGFVGSNLFAIARQPANKTRVDSGERCGPVLLFEFPGERQLEILSSEDHISPRVFLSERSTYTHSEWSPLIFNRETLAQSTLESVARQPHNLLLDERRLLYIAEDTLHCQDIATGRLKWFRPDVDLVAYIKGDLAVVRRPDPNHAPQGYRTFISLLNLTDGRIIHTIEPGYYQQIADVSPDQQWMAILMNEGVEMWSLKERRRAWRKFHYETNCRIFRFTSDSQQLESAGIDESNTLRPMRIRTSDGERLASASEDDRPAGRASSAVSLPGSRSALFHVNNRHASGLPIWLEPHAMHWGLLGTPQSLPWMALLFDTEAGRLTGMLDTTNGQMMTSPDREAFALARLAAGRSRLELYTLPPRSNWMWWILRSVVLPLPLLALAVGLHRRELRRGNVDRLKSGDSRRGP